MQKIRTVVCGTTFGLFYLEALRRLNDKFEIVGILANGSERSKRCAANFNTTLYTDIRQVPKDIDLACVVIRTRALGGKGTEIAAHFLENGINVIQEQPIHPKDLEECYRIALKNGVYFQTGDVYPHLDGVETFIRSAHKLNEIHDRPLYMNLSFAPQVSYPLMDILMNSLPDIRSWEFSGNVKAGPFRGITGTLNKIPVCMEIHNEVFPKDPDNNMHLLHSITYMYESGHLSLQDTFGPAIWNPRLDIPVELYNYGDVKSEVPEYMYEKTGHILGGYHSRNFKQIITDIWPEAVKKDLLLVLKGISDKRLLNAKGQKEMICSRQWNEMTKYLGYADIMDKKLSKATLTDILEKSVQEQRRHEYESC